MKTWLDGVVLDADRAAVRASDHGLTVGDGVFETMKVSDGVPFALTRHLVRLRRSAEGMGLDAPSHDHLRAAVAEVINANAEESVGRLRITLTGGPGPSGTARGDSGPTLLVTCSAASPWPPSTAVVTVPWRRNEYSAVTGIKTTSYAENVVALARAQQQGASEALFLNTQGRLCEGTGSNLLLGLEGLLLTPPLSSGCLAGVTRELVIEWCGVVEGDLLPSDGERATEVALTSSTRDVHPVHALDGRELTAPGPLTAAAMATFAARAKDEVDP